MTWDPRNLNRVAVVVCAANLTASDKCPLNCGKCWYGGKIPVQWTFADQGYVQYYPSRDAIDQDFEATKQYWLDNGGDSYRAKMEALKEWLDKNPEKKRRRAGQSFGDSSRRGRCRSMKLTKASIDLILSWLPREMRGDFLFTCPICHQAHIKSIRMTYDIHRDGYNLTSYLQTATTPICYECMQNKSAEVQAYLKDLNQKLQEASRKVKA